MKLLFYIFINLLFLVPVCAQYRGKSFSVSFNAVYTTSAKLYLNPNSPDPAVRNQSFLLEDIFNPAVDIRFHLTDPLIIGLNVDYMKKTSSGPNLRIAEGNTIATVIVEDGFLLIPVELSIHYLLPFSTENFKFLMGGGAGYYYGEQIRKFEDIEIETIERENAYGIQVSISMDYLINDYVGLRSEMKFRDPQFNLKNRYKNQTRIPQGQFDSKVNVDGVTFVLGAFINL